MEHPVWRWLPYTLAVHALLPLALWAGWVVFGAETTASVVLWAHGAFAVLLLGTAPWWWRHTGAVAMLILLDHLATFVVGALIVGLVDACS